MSRTQCSLRGFRCPKDEPCDCRALCPHDDFRAFRVDEEDDIVMLDRKLEPGTYCLPNDGIADCNRKTQITIYSLAGWTCIDRHRSVYGTKAAIACQNPLARNEELNRLVDRVTDTTVDDFAAIDFNELLADGSRRYKCRCDSLDVFGNRMVGILPFVCAVDYCLEDLVNQPNLGWRNGICECGPFPHKVAGDYASPCVRESTHVENDKTLHMRVECTSRKSFDRKAWYCPPGVEGVISAEERVYAGEAPFDFVAAHYSDFVSIT